MMDEDQIAELSAKRALMWGKFIAAILIILNLI